MLILACILYPLIYSWQKQPYALEKVQPTASVGFVALLYFLAQK